jgi:hypothetical protein
MPSHSNSFPHALLPPCFFAGLCLVHKYYCQTWSMGLWWICSSHDAKKNHAMDWWTKAMGLLFGAGACRPWGKLFFFLTRPWGKLAEKEAWYMICRYWKLWAQLRIGKDGELLTGVKGASIVEVRWHFLPWATRGKTTEFEKTRASGACIRASWTSLFSKKIRSHSAKQTRRKLYKSNEPKQQRHGMHCKILIKHFFFNLIKVN